MRSKLIWLAATAPLVLAGACVDSPNCHPVSSFSSPVFTCAVAVETPPPPPAPAPAPEPTPAPAPAPPAKANLSDKSIDVTEQVEFETDSDKLLENSKKILDDVIQILKDHPDITKIQIEGYTDSDGSRDHNKKLSQARANAVKAYLTANGIEAGRLASKGFGQDSPIADNKTPEGKHKNRRVEFKILTRK